MFRSILLRLSRERWLRNWMQNSPAGAKFTSRFVAGRSLEEALVVCGRLRGEGILSSLDRLGENVTNLAEARQSCDAYLKVLDGIADTQLGATVSIKLTQLGLDESEAAARENVRVLAERAKLQHTQVEIDMESSGYVDRTLEIVREQHRLTGNIRAVIQACLYRSGNDLDELCREGVPVRLCKGAYQEPETTAFPHKQDVDRNYSKLMKTLLERGTNPAIASHDERLVAEAVEVARRRNLAPDAFEFQMLYGVRRDLQRKLIDQGFRLRIYVPFGEAWYPYFMRRMAERPANLWFVVKNVLRA